MTDDRDAIREGITTLIARADPDLHDHLESDPAAHLRLIAIAAALRDEATATLDSAVGSARAAGISWDRIGGVLGMSRQAAQQRFGVQVTHSTPEVRRLTPVTAFTEMERLNQEGTRGWHSIGYGPLFHDLIRADVQWEHRRVLMFGDRPRALEDEGWNRVGTAWFPWAYYARPTDIPALDAPQELTT